MAELNFATGLWVVGGCSDRFCTGGYSQIIGIEEQIAAAARVPGIEAFECHQTDFDNITTKRFKQLLDQHGLGCSLVNTNVWSQPVFKWGGYTNRDPKVRAQAIAEGKRAVDVAREIGCPAIGHWLGADGHDYPFQVDHSMQWELEVDGIRTVAEYAAPDVKVGIEYKLREPRNHMLIGDVGKALCIVMELGLENVGVAVDFGHSLVARENPGESVALLARHGKLFNVHFNDCYREWDDDMIPGTVHFWETLEFLHYVKKTNYRGYLGLDMFPYRENGVEAATLAIENIKAMWALVDKLDLAALEAAQEKMDAVGSQRVVRSVIFSS